MPRTNARERGRDDREDDRADDRRSGRGGASSKKGGDGFSYHRRDSEEVNRRAKQSSGRYDSFVTEEITWYKPRDGENEVRIIPWLSGDDPDFDKLAEKWGTHWGIDLIVHYNVGTDGGSYLCNDKMNGDPCPPCDAYRDGEDELKGSDRVMCWLIDRKDEKAGVQAWAMPLANSKDISAVSKIKGSGEVLLIDDPEEGYDIFFEREGEKKRTKYKRFEVARNPSPLHENEKKQQAWLDYITEHRLPDLLKFYDVEYLDKVLSGQSSKREDEDSGEDRGGSSRRGRGREDDAGERSSSRRGRGDEEASEETGGRASSRRGRDRGEEEGEGDFTRPSRRRGSAEEAEPEEAAEEAGEERGGGRAERSSRRSSSRDEAPEPRSSRRGRAAEPEEPEADDDAGGGKGSRGGRTERYRGGAKDAAEDEGGDDKGAARDRLSRVGRRGRG